ncbi:rhamnulokinase family protein [Verrucomicrobiota bacterium]
MSKKNLLAVDLGASGGKCFVGTFEGDSLSMKEIHRFEHGGVSFFTPDSSGKISERTYWDDVYIYDNIVKGLHAYKREFSDTLDSIGIDTWGADGQFVSKDGDMADKIYCYRDHRLDNMIDEVKARIEPKRIYEITGIHFQPYNVSNQVLWFSMNRKDMLKPGCFYLPIPSVFYYYLGGIRKVDSAWASVTQLMDAKTKKWSTEIFEKLEVPVEVMPEIVEPGTEVGELLKPLAESAGINQAKLIAVGSHDTAAAFAAAPVDNPDEALVISSGTWCLVGKMIPEPITSQEAMDAVISNEGGIGNIRFLKNCVGLWLVQELRKIWGLADGKDMDWAELIGMAQAAKPFTAFINVDDTSFYNPTNMEEAIADFCKKTGQTVPEDRGTFLRVAYESLAMKFRHVNEQICSVCGKESKVVNIVGGGSKNELLNQFTANATGLPVVAGPEEATAVGNLMVQAMGLGIIKSMPEAQPFIRKAFPIKDYQPQDAEAWNKAYDQYKQIIS